MMENFVTSLVLQGPIYIFAFCMLGMAHYEDIQKLQIILNHANVSLESLQVREAFWMKVKNEDHDEEMMNF